MNPRLCLALAVALLVLPGCSAIKVVYNQADRVVAWRADDYFDLNPEQKEALRGPLERFHAWHRSTQLPDYAVLLESAQKRLHAGVTVTDVDWAIDAIKARYRVLVLQGYADAARVLSTLSDQQLAAARRQFDKDNRRYAKDFGVGLAPEEQKRLRAKRNLERIEHWTGPLAAAQEAKLLEISRALPLVTELRHQDRVRRQREFLALLEGRAQLDTFAPRLRDWLLDWDRSRSPQYEAELSRFVEASAKAYVEMYNLLTPEQRNHAAERLQRYVQAFRELARETPRTTVAAQP
jgi:hypothetical protein